MFENTVYFKDENDVRETMGICYKKIINNDMLNKILSGLIINYFNIYLFIFGM